MTMFEIAKLLKEQGHILSDPKAPKDSDSDSEDEKPAAKKARTASGSGSGFNQEFTLSADLAAVVGATKLSRPKVVKGLWVYIKEHNLQDPSDKRQILCDAALRRVFGQVRASWHDCCSFDTPLQDSVSMFSMNKHLAAHFLDE